MVAPRKKTTKSSFKGAPAKTVEGREAQVIAEAMDMAEEQIRNRTASSQVLTHFLKLGSTVARLELEKLKHENELLAAKTENLKSMKDQEKLYKKALIAMSEYKGGSVDEGLVIDDDDD